MDAFDQAAVINGAQGVGVDRVIHPAHHVELRGEHSRLSTALLATPLRNSGSGAVSTPGTDGASTTGISHLVPPGGMCPLGHTERLTGSPSSLGELICARFGAMVRHEHSLALRITPAQRPRNASSRSGVNPSASVSRSTQPRPGRGGAGPIFVTDAGGSGGARTMAAGGRPSRSRTVRRRSSLETEDEANPQLVQGVAGLLWWELRSQRAMPSRVGDCGQGQASGCTDGCLRAMDLGDGLPGRKRAASLARGAPRITSRPNPRRSK